MRPVPLGDLALAALVLMGMALAMSRRNLHISFALCLLALGFLGWGFVRRWMLG